MGAISIMGLLLLAAMVIGGVVLVSLIAAAFGSRNGQRSSAGPILAVLLVVPVVGIAVAVLVAYFSVERVSHQQAVVYHAMTEAEAAQAEAVARTEQVTARRTSNSEIPVEVTTTAEEPTPEVSEAPATEEAEPTEDPVATEPTEDSPVEEVAEDAAEEMKPVGEIMEESIEDAIAAIATRPDWVDHEEPFKDGSVYKWPLELELAVDQDEAEREFLADAVDGAIREYVRTRLSLGSRSGVAHLSGHDIAKELIVDRWAEPVHASTGDFVKLHVLLEFDRETNRQIEERWTQHIAGQRLWTAGGWLGIGLLALTFAFTYLRFDLATNGKYRRRLRFATATAILVFAVGGLAWLA